MLSSVSVSISIEIDKTWEPRYNTRYVIVLQPCLYFPDPKVFFVPTINSQWNNLNILQYDKIFLYFLSAPVQAAHWSVMYPCRVRAFDNVADLCLWLVVQDTTRVCVMSKGSKSYMTWHSSIPKLITTPIFGRHWRSCLNIILSCYHLLQRVTPVGLPIS